MKDIKNYIIFVMFVILLYQNYELRRTYYIQTKELRDSISSISDKIKAIDKRVHLLKVKSKIIKNEVNNTPVNIGNDVGVDSIRAILKGYYMPYNHGGKRAGENKTGLYKTK